MKKWFIILMTAFTLTGCSDSPKNVTNLSSQIEEKDLSGEVATDVFKEEIPEVFQADNMENSNEKTPEKSTTDNTENAIKYKPSHEYFCDKFLLTVDQKQFDLTTIDPEISSVSELYPITDEQLYILGRVDENDNSLMIYDFIKEDFIFAEHGSTMCWVQNKFETVRYLKDNVVYDLAGNIIYQPDESKLISMIEYVVEDFKITITDSEYENPEEIWVE